MPTVGGEGNVMNISNIMNIKEVFNLWACTYYTLAPLSAKHLPTPLFQQIKKYYSISLLGMRQVQNGHLYISLRYIKTKQKSLESLQTTSLYYCNAKPTLFFSL